jgi:hypothetical protein
MGIEQRIKALHFLGEYFRNVNEAELSRLFADARNTNPWFVEDYTRLAFNGLKEWLREDILSNWVKPYLPIEPKSKIVGLVLAGNIPFVGIHDILSVLITGHSAKLKVSSQDIVLTRFFLKSLQEVEPQLANRLEEIFLLKDIDAAIATGSNNTSRYFETYFGKYPNIIRRNRTSIAVLDGTESVEDLSNLHDDLFLYFSLGCRNVSKIYIPEGFDLIRLIEASNRFAHHFEHHKYLNNYDYNKAVYLVNRVPHLDSGYFMLKEDEALVSPLSVIFYEYYKNLDGLRTTIDKQKDNIQCIVGHQSIIPSAIPFGQAQFPNLTDYADNVDTIEFLKNL